MAGFTWIPVFCLFSVTSCAVLNDSALNGEVLRQMGEIFKNPLLRLLGTAFDDIEQGLKEKIRNRDIEVLEGDYSKNITFMDHICQLLKCGRWSNWTECQMGPYEYSMKLRGRACGVDTDLCKYSASDKRNETQSEVCTWRDSRVNSCPSNYDVVNGQFCFRYSSSQESQERAAELCEYDGGHLVHLDSQKKANALHKYLREILGLPVSHCIWLNGKRESKYTPWEYTYGDRNPSWTNWSSGEPSNGSSELCTVEESDPRRMWDRECSNSYNFVCEIA